MVNWEWEWNSSNTDKYFHLYNGWIPKDSIIDWKESWNWSGWSK